MTDRSKYDAINEIGKYIIDILHQVNLPDKTGVEILPPREDKLDRLNPRFGIRLENEILGGELFVWSSGEGEIGIMSFEQGDPILLKHFEYKTLDDINTNLSLLLSHFSLQVK